MESKKTNIFMILLVVAMCIFTVFISIQKSHGQDGIDGKSAYERAIELGLFSGTELEYYQSLHGKDGSNITIGDVYDAYLFANNLTENDVTFIEFINTYYPDVLLDSSETISQTEIVSTQALRSTVDIAYGCYLNKPIINAEPATAGAEPAYILSSSTYAPIGVSAGSGVIYQINSDTAYIITNFHVVYVSNYTNDDSYNVFYDSSKQEYFTAKYDESALKNEWFYQYILKSDLAYAPLSTHFLESYEIYLYGYQESEYALTATYVGGSAENDIAILKIDKNKCVNNQLIFNGDYKAVALGNSSDIATGEGVLAVGNPLLANTSSVDTSNGGTIADKVESYKQTYIDALCLATTDGVVSNISENQIFSSLLYNESDINLRLIRVSSAINAGNSGGGLYDMNGRLIGIVNGKISSEEYDNVGYAIPINIAKNLADRIILECEGITGDVTIKIINDKSLGLTLKSSKSGIKKPYYDEDSLSWINQNSVQVSAVASGLANTAGIKKDDLINSIEFNGTNYDLFNDYDFNDVLLNLQINNASSIKFYITRLNSGLSENIIIEVNITSENFVNLK